MTGPSTWRILRAFAWLRWRILINSLERRGSRDVIERFSVAFEQLAPAMVAIMMVPSAAALAAIGGYAGWTLGQGHPDGAFSVIRIALFAACALTVVGPILLPAAERTNAVPLLLLPIPRAVLYFSQSMSAVADPWILLAGVVVLAMPIGLALGGNTTAAGLALTAGLLFLVALVGLSQLVTGAVHLIIRDRRRAELFGLLIVVVLPVAAMLPGLLGSGRHRPAAPGTERSRQVQEPRRSSSIERTAMAAVPSEIYASAARSAATPDPAAALGSVAVLGAAAAVLHGIALLAFGRILASPGGVGPTRAVSSDRGPGWRIPGSSLAVSAVAVNQVRLALRTPRGRATFLSPLVVLGLMAVMMIRGQSGMDFGPIRMESGIGLAAFASFVSLMSILPLAMNQFAIDRAGLTMALLSPLDTVALLRGKAIGNGLIAAVPTAICLTVAAALFPSGDPRLWLCIPLTLIAAYLLVAPLAAILSAVFPKAVDLNSIGRHSNAHGAAGLLGMLAFIAAGAPGLGISMLVGRTLDRPALAPLALLPWVAIAFAISLALFQLAAALFERRKENLGMISQRPA
jgi:hypothetical protein